MLDIRESSRFFNKKISKFNICKNYVINKFKTKNVDYIIHGYFHRQSIDEIFIGKKRLYRICLSDWSNYGSFVKIDFKSVKLIKLVFFLVF